MNKRVITSLGSVGLNFITPVLLKLNPDWEIFNGSVEELSNVYPFTPDEVLYPPSLDDVKKDKDAFPNFLSEVESLGLPPPVYDEFKMSNTAIRDRFVYSLGPLGQNMLMSNGWSLSRYEDIRGEWKNIDGALFLVDPNTLFIHWNVDGKYFGNPNMNEAIQFLEGNKLLGEDDVKELRRIVNDVLRSQNVSIVRSKYNPHRRGAGRVTW